MYISFTNSQSWLYGADVECSLDERVSSLFRYWGFQTLREQALRLGQHDGNEFQ